jgi:hypothetical protein
VGDPGPVNHVLHVMHGGCHAREIQKGVLRGARPEMTSSSESDRGVVCDGTYLRTWEQARRRHAPTTLPQQHNTAKHSSTLGRRIFDVALVRA